MRFQMTDVVKPEPAQPTAPDSPWVAWNVAENSGFEVRHKGGRLGLTQKDPKNFWVEREFRFTDDAVVAMLTGRLVRRGWKPNDAAAAVEDARTFTPADENPTDLASIPRFMRWFETAYGLHTLAAIIHDNLIVEEPNGGALKDDTLSDRFFREMMKAVGVKWLKRWIIWSAVALRSRWAVGGLRRLAVIVWLLLAASGLTAFVWSIGTASLSWASPLDSWVLGLVALVLPFAAAGLWGKQYGGGLVAAIAATWILPAAILAGVGYGVYECLEWLRGQGWSNVTMRPGTGHEQGGVEAKPADTGRHYTEPGRARSFTGSLDVASS